MKKTNQAICLSVLVIFLFSMNLFSQTSVRNTTNADSEMKTSNKYWKKWLKKKAKHIDSLESENYEDLKFLKNIIGERRIVQLGEGGHGMKEYSQAKTRLIKFLHQEMGFEIIAFESSFYQCYQSDLSADKADSSRSLYGCVFGVWHTKEVLNLFEYIKKSRQTDKPLRYVGFDIQPIGRNKEDRPDFLKKIVAQVDPEYSGEVFELDNFFLKEYAQKSSERRKSFRENRSKFVEGYEKLAEFIEKNKAKLTKKENPKNVLAAMQTAKFLAQYIKQQTAPDLKTMFELRDEGMANNIEFIAEKLYPNKKIIIWGHNAHVRYKNEAIPPSEEIYPRIATRMMGSWLKEKYAGNIYTIGFYAGKGSAANNGRKVYEITDAGEELLESVFNQAKGKYIFVDFLNQRKKMGMNWMFTVPVTVRYNGRHPQEMIIADQYDGIFFIKTVSPPEYLY